jgi:HEPN domain-containing protein
MEKFFMKENEEKVKLVKDWLKFAKENLLLAKTAIKEDYSPYHTICFLCQSSTEKYLKAFLIWNDWELKKIHDLLDLLAFCVNFEPEFEKLKNECASLNEYITAGRYPGDLPFENIGKSDAEESIKSTEKVEKLVLEKIGFLYENDKNNMNNNKQK